jgi:hypothetical protein
MGMGISPVMNQNFYPAGSANYQYTPPTGNAQAAAGATNANGSERTFGTGGVPGSAASPTEGVGKPFPTSLKSPSVTDEQKEQECETCKDRKYQDASNEMVSMKSATPLSPEAAASAVRGHEQEHVSNAYKKAAQNNGKVVSAAVSIHMGVCPECGRSYVSGGTTHTMILYKNEENPYQKDLKAGDYLKYGGKNLNKAV